MKHLQRPGEFARTVTSDAVVTVEPLEGRLLFSAAHLKLPKYANGTHAYADGAFQDANWQSIPVIVGAGGASTALRQKAGGSPGAYQLVTDTVNSGEADSAIFGFHGNLKAIFNPATQGAITTITYSEHNRLFSGFGQGERTGPALEQGGQIYFLLDQALLTPQSKWAAVTVKNLTAASFSTLDTAAHPDFSQAGAPIEFGYYRANSSGESGYTIEAGIDDWKVKLKTRRLV